jgi:excisionase family DNA binding protein
MEAPKTQTIAEAAKELGIGKNQAYAAARRGEIPTIRIGNRIQPFKKMLGLSSAEN